MTAEYISGRVLVLGDLHFRSIWSDEDDRVLNWIWRQLRSGQYTWLVLNGDTFELSLVRDAVRTHEAELRQILALHGEGLNNLLKRSGLAGIVLLTGDHDFRLDGLTEIIRGCIDAVPLKVAEVAFHFDTSSAIIHGHQFDFNLTSNTVEGVAFTERVSSIFERFVFDGSAREEAFREACEEGRFSFWYAAGCLPAYLEGLRSIFGYRPAEYRARFQALVRSPFFRAWLGKLPNGLNRALAFLAHAGAHIGAAGGTDITDWLVAKLPGLLFINRCQMVLRTGLFPSTLVDVQGLPEIRNLIVAHAHAPIDKTIRVCGRVCRLCAVATPRAHVAGALQRSVRLEYHHAFASLSELGVEFVGNSYQILKEV
jgi:hypothetical protein